MEKLYGPVKVFFRCLIPSLLLFILFFLVSCYEQFPYFIQVPEFYAYYPDDGSEGIYLSIFTSDDKSQIRYTTDGRVPSESYGEYYEGSIHLTEAAFVQATAYREGYDAGPVADYYYNPDQ